MSTRSQTNLLRFIILRPIAITLLSLGFARAVTPEPATLTVQVDKPGIRIRPSLYGLPAEGATTLKHIFPPYSVTILRLQPASR